MQPDIVQPVATQPDIFQSIIILCFGAAMVGIYSWTRFDEPSFDSQSEHFARYKPRFSTSYTRYRRAKLCYVCAIVLLYFVFSFVPQLFTSLPASTPSRSTPLSP